MNENSAAEANNQYFLGQIDAKVTHLLDAQRQYRDDLKEMSREFQARLDGHEVRITKVEQGHWRFAGVVSIVPILLTIAGLVGSYLK